jgi:acetyl esterase/lipase
VTSPPTSGRLTVRDNGFHPELRSLARFVPRTLFTPRTFRVMRPLVSAALFGAAKDAEALILPSGNSVRLHIPVDQDGPSPALLWMHGGAYLSGHPQHTDGLCHRFSRKLGITVAAPSYRFAPEHPYPAALEDCYAALQWLASLPAVDPARIAVGGDSAGGGLAAALAFMARDRGEISLALQLLNYPMLDDRAVAKRSAARRYRMWNERSNRFAWAAYLGDADPEVAVPARRTDLAGLPRAWLGVGTEDLFYDEIRNYAQRLRDANVPCHLEVAKGAFHTFDFLAPRTSVARAYFASQCEALRTAFAPAG